MPIQDGAPPPTLLDQLHRTLYLRREYALVAACGEFDDVLLTPPLDDTIDGALWHGLLIVRQPSSPWYGGVFTFVVRVPPKYPFECPTVCMESPLKSHPSLLGDAEGRRCVVPFDNIYFGLDPMRVSVMARMLHFIRSIFYPSEWIIDVSVDKFLARHDVERRSVTQEVILGKPYVEFLSREAVTFFTELKCFPACDIDVDVSESDKEWESKFSLWFGRTWLPTARLLQ